MAPTAQNRGASGSRTRPRPDSGFRPRRGPSSWSPFTSGSSYDSDEDRYWLDHEMTLLERALREEGEMRRRDLGQLVGCKYWGPGRFARALKAAVERGRIAHVGFGRYGPNA